MQRLSDITVLLAVKDRDNNLAFCLESINTSTPVPKVVLVAFGNKTPLRYLARKYAWLKVIWVTRNTKMFHKARALNIGIRTAQTKFVCLTDVDQLFQPNFFVSVVQELTQNTQAFVRCETHFLPTLPAGLTAKQINHDIYFKLLKHVMKKATKKPHGEGCCHGIARDRLLNIHGHDEAYIGWGFEDKDLAMRITATGAKTTWITGKTSMIHLPHKRDKHYFAPTTRNANEALYRKKLTNLEIVANQTRKWGKL